MQVLDFPSRADGNPATKLCERRWVTTLFDTVLSRLEREFLDSGNGELFNRLKGYLLSEEHGSRCTTLAAP
jgi:hypothetical protein